MQTVSIYMFNMVDYSCTIYIHPVAATCENIIRRFLLALIAYTRSKCISSWYRCCSFLEIVNTCRFVNAVCCVLTGKSEVCSSMYMLYVWLLLIFKHQHNKYVHVICMGSFDIQTPTQHVCTCNMYGFF